MARSHAHVYNAAMVQNRPATPNDLTAGLGQLGDLRVWSVIITIFGDAVMPRGGTVPTSALAAITERLSIKPEALRVALYRLAKDSWVTRQKTGRNSFYALSGSGRAEFLPASRRIYADAPALHGPWRLAALPPLAEAARAELGRKLRDAGFLRLTSALYLGPDGAGPPPADAMVVEGDLACPPRWARQALAPDALQADYDRLFALLDSASDDLIREGIDSLDAVALRTLLIHRWRRLLLRHPDLPVDLMPAGWRGEDCRSLVLALHENLSPLADPWLDAAIGPRGDPSKARNRI
ncbi:MAG: phenylacetic acid degradation protein [Rhodobacteraceae bacterium]|nr:phenylacetic acid degradation protein [Paracoccaceae bacterium]